MERHRIFCALRFIVAIKIICKTNSAKEQQQQQNQPVSKKKCSETVKKYIVRQSKVVKIISKLQKYKNGINWSVLLCFSCSFESYLHWKWTEKIYQKKMLWIKSRPNLFMLLKLNANGLQLNWLKSTVSLFE